MHIKTIASATIIAAALGFSGFAWAQDAATTDMALPTMIGNQEVSEADAQRVKVHCEDLQTAENQAEGAGEDANSAEDTATDDTATSDADSEPTALGSVDFEAITLENCIEAGFIEETP